MITKESIGQLRCACTHAQRQHDRRLNGPGLPNKTWVCKIGEVGAGCLPDGSDMPMREAVKEAFRELVGRYPDFCFSGWDGDLDEAERACVEERAPREEYFVDYGVVLELINFYESISKFFKIEKV